MAPRALCAVPPQPGAGIQAVGGGNGAILSRASGMLKPARAWAPEAPPQGQGLRPYYLA